MPWSQQPARAVATTTTRWLMRSRVLLWFAPAQLFASDPMPLELERRFTASVRPFLESYCLECHDRENAKADLDLSPFSTMAAVVQDQPRFELVLERLEAGEMPPEKAKRHPNSELRQSIVSWIRDTRRYEAERNAGDPGPVAARRLSNAEYDYTIRDLTGVDIRPTKEFPVDPANQAGFANSGESLAMTPALLKKYLGAARTVAEHLVLKPDGLTFAPHPVVADTDRDKYAVLRIVDFYKRQPTDHADYFMAAWRYQNCASFGNPDASLADIAAEARVSSKYLETIWGVLTHPAHRVGPIAKLQALWQALPVGGEAEATRARHGCEQIRDFVVQLREKIVPEVKNLTSPSIQNGSQTLVMWKNRRMAANRRRYDPATLQVPSPPPTTEPAGALATEATSGNTPASAEATPDQATAGQRADQKRRNNQPSPIPEYIQKGGVSLPPAVLTTGSSATFKLAAAKKRGPGPDPDLAVPVDPVERSRVEAAFAQFADTFPDAFYITERGRVYLDPEKEQANAGRLLSAGLHSMTGYFRDDAPLYHLILDLEGQRELDRLWQEFDFAAAIPHRMHTSFVWFERTDSMFMRDPEFDPFRPEDKSVTEPAKIKRLGEIYLAKAVRNNASETAQRAIQEHFEIVAADNLRVAQERTAAEPIHLKALLRFAERAYRGPLPDNEQNNLLAFYRACRDENGLDHEEALRDSIVRVLMSPHFCYRVDLIDETGADRIGEVIPPHKVRPLSNHALASRLSYFLWSSMPDAGLLAHAAAGDLNRPETLTAEARRLLQDSRISNFALEFGGHWLDFRRFEEHNAVDRDRFPAFDGELRQAMFEEPIRFLVDLVQNDRSVLECLYGDYTFVNPPLAKHYGLPDVSSAGEWVRLEHASRFGRGGLLPMSVFLTANSPGLRTSPVKRGYWVVRRLLGERIPPPPAVVPELPNDEKHLGDLTLRETLSRHREDKACASCHARFDSLGLVFEGYGPVGERRNLDFGGRPVETHATFPGGTEGAGLAGLRGYLQAHRENDFLENLCRKLVAYGLGRTLLPSDDTLIAHMRTELAAHDYRFSSLIECIVTSPQFRNQRTQ